ncbi:MAG: molybdopterin-dependent oxidoreductase [Eubacteriales bacterium]|nr:molybdopterin-dependent oxidoreductase [Eubacteriales bacterium]
MKRILPLLAALLLLLAACYPQEASPGADAVSAATQARYRENEVRDYQGARLDPAVGPRDNSIKGIQEVDISQYALVIDGLVGSPVSLQYDQVLELPAHERLITLHCVEGWDATVLWEGVLLEELMSLAGIKPDAVTVIFSSVDGYTTSLPLETILEKGLILAYGANGLDLPPALGYPFMVVAEDKLGYKWARWVDTITLSDDADYKGFWENLGYPNDADVPPGRGI